MKTLIRNGQIITAVDNYKADILIEGETISVIGAKLDMEADLTIDATDRLIIPGGIDPHTHMELPFGGTTASDDFTTGTIAARAWGHDFNHRFRGAVQRRITAPGCGQLAPEGRGQVRHRLWLSFNYHRTRRQAD
jgi:cytosine/adenosine deaminase-related metal-dependent hydrolase